MQETHRRGNSHSFVLKLNLRQDGDSDSALSATNENAFCGRCASAAWTLIVASDVAGAAHVEVNGPKNSYDLRWRPKGHLQPQAPLPTIEAFPTNPIPVSAIWFVDLGAED